MAHLSVRISFAVLRDRRDHPGGEYAPLLPFRCFWPCFGPGCLSERACGDSGQRIQESEDLRGLCREGFFHECLGDRSIQAGPWSGGGGGSWPAWRVGARGLPLDPCSCRDASPGRAGTARGQPECGVYLKGPGDRWSRGGDGNSGRIHDRADQRAGCLGQRQCRHQRRRGRAR